MHTSLRTISLCGLDAQSVLVECNLAPGLHGISIVGLADRAIKEAKDRLAGAFHAMGVSLPPKRLTFNLVPVDQPKFGGHFDLPLALATLAALDLVPKERLQEFIIMGALGLGGRIFGVEGVMPAAIEAHAQGLGLIFPYENQLEASLVGEIPLIGAKTLPELVSILLDKKPVPSIQIPPLSREEVKPHHIDFSEIRGMTFPKRMAEIAAAGGHPMFMMGPPGVGKSLLAQAMPALLPPMSALEIRDTALVYSAAGKGFVHLSDRRPHVGSRDDAFALGQRPFRAPHHTASAVALIGGGHRAKPGEISLAHNGILFLDELPEFHRDVLESLRQPLEAGEILISRAENHVTYPARFLLVAAANPCPCGRLDDRDSWCNRAPLCGRQYLGRLSGALMDRFSLSGRVEALNAYEMMKAPLGPSTHVIAARVLKARERQSARDEGLLNEGLGPGRLDAEIQRMDHIAQKSLEMATQNLALSTRGYYRLVKVARTVADLEGSDVIHDDHICEAVLYKNGASLDNFSEENVNLASESAGRR